MTQRQQLVGKLFTLLLPFTIACSGGDDSDGGDTAATNPWNGKTYLLQVAKSFWSEPRGAVLEFEPYVRGFLIQVDGQSIDSYQATIATLDVNGWPAMDGAAVPPAAQDTCNPTTTVSGSGNVINGEIAMNIRHKEQELSVIAPARSFNLTNVLPTAETLVSSFAGTLDAREISLLFTRIDPDPTPQQLCDALLDLATPAPCEPCPQDGQPWCLTLEATHRRDFRAVETDLKIQPVSMAEATSAACTGKLGP